LLPFRFCRVALMSTGNNFIILDVVKALLYSVIKQCKKALRECSSARYLVQQHIGSMPCGSVNLLCGQ
jgi:hypothetical protein